MSLNFIRTWLEGWNLGEYDKDLGEDFIVQIYDGQGSSGLSFNVQAKSVSDLTTKLAVSGAPASTSLEVKDLLHWEDQNPPVVVVLIDVATRSGFWNDVPDILAQLDQDKREWRTQKTVTVRFPSPHQTDPSGRAILRQRIASLALPLHAHKPLSFNLTFRFPTTPAGDAANLDLARAINEGEQVVISSEHIANFSTSSWFERLFGRLEAPTSVTIRPSEAAQTMQLILHAAGQPDAEGIPISLVRRKAGLRKAIFDNHAEGEALSIQMIVVRNEEEPASLSATLAYSLLGVDVRRSLTVARFLLLIQPKGEAILSSAEGTAIGTVRIPTPMSLDDLKLVERVLTKLAAIQHALPKDVSFDLSKGIPRAHIMWLEGVHDLLLTGEWHHPNKSWDLPLPQREVRTWSRRIRSKELMTLELRYTQYSVTIFGIRIPLGRVCATLANQDALNRAVVTVQDGLGILSLRDASFVLRIEEPSAELPSKEPATASNEP